MKINDAVLNRQALVLFNFWLKKRQNDRRIGDLTIGDFVEMCEVLTTAKIKKNTRKNYLNKNQKRKETQMNHESMHTFYFEGQKIRIVMKDGRPWFVLDDICKTLEINPNELSENELKIAKTDLNNLKNNLIDFNSAKK
jgi:DNA-binding Xre family transcriptional regulator